VHGAAVHTKRVTQPPKEVLHMSALLTSTESPDLDEELLVLGFDGADEDLDDDDWEDDDDWDDDDDDWDDDDWDDDDEEWDEEDEDWEDDDT
jgi:hypothetical protein